MAKKGKKKAHSKRKGFKPGYIIFIAIALLLGVGFILGLKQAAEPECANSVTCISDLNGEYNPHETEGEFMGSKVQSPEYIAHELAFPKVLGESDAPKRIEVDLTNQRLYTYEGDKLVHNFLVSTGKWGRTPTGTFRIWIKLRSTKMSGGSKALGTYYYLPNVPYTMYFYNDQTPKHVGYGIHGAYWHNNFGHPMSHGCINMKEEEVAQVYAWAAPYSEKHTTYATEDNPGTPVIIYGTAPNE